MNDATQVRSQTNTNGLATQQETIEFVDVGFSLDVTLRELALDQALVEVAVSNSSISANQEGLPPETAEESLQTVLPVKAGGVYLVGSFESQTRERSKALGWIAGDRFQDRRIVYQVWLRSYAVGDLGATEPGRVADQARSRTSSVRR